MAQDSFFFNFLNEYEITNVAFMQKIRVGHCRVVIYWMKQRDPLVPFKCVILIFIPRGHSTYTA